MSKHNHFDLRKVFTMNIGTIVFGILFIYILMSIVLYITGVHINSYQVVSGPLAKNQTYTGVALYSEKLVTAGTGGYVEYYAQDSARIRKGGIVYGVSSTRQASETTAPDSETLSKIRQDMEEFASVYDSTDYHDVYSLKYQIESEILNMTLRNSGLTATTALTLGGETVYTADADAVISYRTDGCEDLEFSTLTSDIFSEKNYRMQSLKTGEAVAAGDPIYREITSEEWSLVIPLTARQIVHLSDNDNIRVKFLKDGVTQYASLTIQTLSDGTYCGKLDFTSGLIRYLDSRYIDIELVTNTAVGLKIPVSAIVTTSFFTVPDEFAVTSDDGSKIGFVKLISDRHGNTENVFTTATIYARLNGKYYIDNENFQTGDIVVRDGTTTDRYILRDTDSLEGVFCINKGYAQFRRIVILDKNENYCIVEKGTDYGISQYDNIVENAAGVQNLQITAK